MNCILCNSEKKKIKLFPKFCTTKNYLCSSCGLVYIPRNKNKILNYYRDDGYYQDSPDISSKNFFFSPSNLTYLAKKRIENMKMLAGINFKDKKVLDIGCGYGEVIGLLKYEYKADVLGLEPSLSAQVIGNKYFKSNILKTTLEEFKTNEKFDFILCSGVIEHLADLEYFFKRVHSLLKKDGKIFIDTQNILNVPEWYSLDHFLYDKHIQNFSIHTLDLILQKNKLYIEKYNNLISIDVWASRDKTKHTIIPKLSPKETINYLSDFQNKYGIKNKIINYVHKIRYLSTFLYFKLFVDHKWKT